MTQHNFFAGDYLDRRAEARLDPDWLHVARADPDARYLLMQQGAALVIPASDAVPARLALLARDDPRALPALEQGRDVVLLGWYGGHRCLLVDLPASAQLARDGEVFAELRPLAAELSPQESSLAAYARALHLWHANHQFCGRCGSATTSERAGHQRRCTACGHTGHPRLDPAIIVLAHDGEHALLGRQASWPPGRYSTIAGFVEPGESLEDAVRRELDEEAGVRAVAVSYHSSQPWPFPSSLMLGFMARAVMTTPVLHDGELEDARWFSRQQLQTGTVLLPAPQAISRRLIDEWVQGPARR